MFCSNCGKKLNEGEKFCSECGEQINWQNSNTENKKNIKKNEIVMNNSEPEVVKKMKCKIHNKDSIVLCRKCGKAICKECDSILDEIENHSYLNEKFDNIGRNLCLDCTLKELSINHFEWDKNLELKLLIALTISYVIGMFILYCGTNADSILLTILGVIITGIVPGAKIAMFWDSTPSDTKKYDVSYTGFGTYQVRENNGGGLPFLIGLISGVFVTPVFIFMGIGKFTKANKIYKFNESIKRKIEDLLKKVYVRNYNKNKLEAIPYTEDGKRYEPPKFKTPMFFWIIIIFFLCTVVAAIKLL